AEAFTRPKIMSRLARLGFTQSYTYFTWRTEKSEMEEYLEELSQSEMVEFFRPNFWPNTPDILTEQLHTGSRPTFLTRFLLAATLSPNYGIYGPPFELLEHIPREPGSEEYRDSEKYEIRYWDLDRPESLAPFIGHVNRLRRANPAFSNLHSLRFHPVDNEQLLAYSKRDEESGNTLLIVVNLDAANPQAGWLTLDREALALEPGERFDVEDLLVGTRYTWGDERQYLRLDPDSIPAHIFRVDREGVAHA
ncbi:MAG: alpha-1,4-glucan--maltose-1-phosphate maltosyltransferase, partial [Dehalococcoidia bacterium]|nr:alpha-1,4-glucan--maltose-1-phosphate maltosyltransferase [Dehalococcoidia bacterium]